MMEWKTDNEGKGETFINKKEIIKKINMQKRIF